MKRILVLLLSLAILVLSGTVAQADGPLRDRLKARLQDRPAPALVQQGKIAGLSVAYSLPAEGAYPAPLVIFSHGLNGCKLQSAFLMRAMAEHGYVVVAPDHADATCGGAGGGAGGKRHRPQERLARYDDWSDKTYADRAADIKNLHAALKADEQWAKRIDWSRVALSGHSLGGYTAVGLAGGWPAWKMEGIRAVLALSPYVGPYLKKGGLAQLSVPVMYQTGTRDLGVKPALVREGGAFDQTPSPAWLVEFEGTGHFGWTELQKGSQDAIARYSLWFLDHALRGADTPLEREEGVADLRAK